MARKKRAMDPLPPDLIPDSLETADPRQIEIPIPKPQEQEKMATAKPPPKKIQPKINPALFAQLQKKEEEAGKSREKILARFNGPEGEVKLIEILTARLISSYDPERPSGRGGGKVKNDDFGKANSGWSTTELYNDLDPETKKGVSLEDFANRLEQLWIEGGGSENEKGEQVNEEDGLFHRTKTTRSVNYFLNQPVLMGRMEAEAQDEENPPEVDEE